MPTSLVGHSFKMRSVVFLLTEIWLSLANEMLGCGRSKHSGLTSVKAYMGENVYWGDDGGTDDAVKIQLTGGCVDYNNGTCTTGVLDDSGNNWSSGDVETYSSAHHDFGDCGNFLGDAQDSLSFKMLVDGSDALCIHNIEFIVNGDTYTWQGTEGESCWQNNQGNTWRAFSSSALFVQGVTTKTIYGKSCSVIGCGKHKSTSYNWCYYEGSSWDYCSRNERLTRYDASCKDPCSNQGGTVYYWCYKVDGGWDYCSPPQ